MLTHYQSMQLFFYKHGLRGKTLQAELTIEPLQKSLKVDVSVFKQRLPDYIRLFPYVGMEVP